MSSESTDRAIPPGAALRLPSLGAGLRGIPAGIRAGLAGGTISLAELVAYPALVIAALVARLWDLGSRAMHHDESLHALYSYNLAVGDGYRHDPMMHGPFQMEATAGLFLLLGDSDFTARLLDEAGIVTTPGNGFGEPGEGFIRLTLCSPADRLKEAVERLQQVSL